MAYPYLVSTVLMTVVVGMAIVLALWVAIKQGW
jgi:hypothetical protein